MTDDIEKFLLRRNPELRAFVEKTVAKAVRFFVGEKRLDVKHLLSDLLSAFVCSDDVANPVTNHLEWAVGQFTYQRLEVASEWFNKLYEKLKEHNIQQRKPHVFNDLDNKVFYIPHRTKRILVVTSQNLRFVYICDNKYFHCRRFWDPYTECFDKDDVYDQKKLEAYKKQGIRKAILEAKWIVDNYADDIAGNKYVKRPSLKYFVKSNWTFPYNDNRDPGYIFTMRTDFLTNGEIDGALYRIYFIEAAVGELNSALSEFIETKDIDE